MQILWITLTQDDHIQSKLSMLSLKTIFEALTVKWPVAYSVTPIP